MRKLLGLLLFVLSITLTSCEKFENGGKVSALNKNLISNPWNFSQYLRNSQDESSTVVFSNLSETYTESGVYTRSYTDEEDEVENETATWEFDKENMRLLVSGQSSIKINDEVNTVSSSYYEIVKLTSTEFWYKYTNGGDEHEFHFTSSN